VRGGKRAFLFYDKECRAGERPAIVSRGCNRIVPEKLEGKLGKRKHDSLLKGACT